MNDKKPKETNSPGKEKKPADVSPGIPDGQGNDGPESEAAGRLIRCLRKFIIGSGITKEDYENEKAGKSAPPLMWEHGDPVPKGWREIRFSCDGDCPNCDTGDKKEMPGFVKMARVIFGPCTRIVMENGQYLAWGITEQATIQKGDGVTLRADRGGGDLDELFGEVRACVPAPSMKVVHISVAVVLVAPFPLILGERLLLLKGGARKEVRVSSLMASPDFKKAVVAVSLPLTEDFIPPPKPQPVIQGHPQAGG